MTPEDKEYVLKKLKTIQSELAWRNSHETNSEFCVRRAEQSLILFMLEMGFEGFNVGNYDYDT